MHTPTAFGGGVCFTGCGGDTPQPVPIVQCGGIGEEERWITVLLHGFLQA